MRYFIALVFFSIYNSILPLFLRLRIFFFVSLFLANFYLPIRQKTDQDNWSFIVHLRTTILCATEVSLAICLLIWIWVYFSGCEIFISSGVKMLALLFIITLFHLLSWAHNGYISSQSLWEPSTSHPQPKMSSEQRPCSNVQLFFCTQSEGTTGLLQV